jgi:hypothetical protein
MLVTITKIHNPKWWYQNLIGSSFEVTETTELSEKWNKKLYTVVNDEELLANETNEDVCGYFIARCDCE